MMQIVDAFRGVSTHSRPKAAGIGNFGGIKIKIVSTHSRPKAAGHVSNPSLIKMFGFNTQPPEGGWR